MDLPAAHWCLSSAVLGGGLGVVRTWLNLQVESGYDRGNPEADLRHAAVGLAPPVVGMLTAAPIERFTTGFEGCAGAVATVGLSHPIAAAGEELADAAQVTGTINLFVIVAVPLASTGLANALQTAVEAKVQALAEARVRAVNGGRYATGTATDSICVACPAETRGMAYAGVATPHGRDLAMAVYRAVQAGAVRYGGEWPT